MRINRSALLSALSIGTRVVPARTTINVLHSALVEPVEGGIILHTTNQEMSLSQRVETADPPRKPFLMPVARLAAILKTCSDDVVSIDPGRTLAIEADGAKWSLPQVEKPTDFPSVAPPVGGGPATPIEREPLIGMLGRIEAAICTDENRANLSGVYAIADGARLTLVATDGHRLATGSLPCGATFTALIAHSHVGVLQRLLGDSAVESVSVRLANGGLLAIDVGTASLGCRLIEAEYPDYRQVIPKRQRVRAVVNAGAMLAALAKLQPVVSDRTRGAEFRFESDALVIESRNPEAGEATVRVRAEIEGDAKPIGLSIRYVSDAIAAVRGERAVIGLDDEVSPITVRSDDTDDTWLGVVMPMRL